jgi:tetraacyldisaccharide-1-P 4'-kinase
MRAAVSELLEQGRLAPPPATRVLRALCAAWGRALGRTIVRRLAWPRGLRVVAVGGSTLGGSGKTPLAMACAAELARSAAGIRVALVGHAYRARPGYARVVGPADAIADVGDEALLAARELERRQVAEASTIQVVVAPTRQAAIDLAARIADVLVLDGVTQTAPVRASLALLAVDPGEPWGRAGAVPPWGDLRAPVASMVDAVDRVVAVGDTGELEGAGRISLAPAMSRGAFLGDKLLGWDDLRALRVGLLCALARPERVLRSLARRGLRPHIVLRAGDHGPLPASAQVAGRGGRSVDLWLATPKCALHASRLDLSTPLATLEHTVELPADVAGSLTAVVQGHNLETSRNVSQIAAREPRTQLARG